MANEEQPTTSASKVRAALSDWRFRGLIATSLFEPFYPISPVPGHCTARSKSNSTHAKQFGWLFFVNSLRKGRKYFQEGLDFWNWHDFIEWTPSLMCFSEKSPTKSSLSAGINLNLWSRRSSETKTWYVVRSKSFCEFQRRFEEREENIFTVNEILECLDHPQSQSNTFYVRFRIQFHFLCLLFAREFIFRKKFI